VRKKKPLKPSSTNVGWGEDYEECYLRAATLGSNTIILAPVNNEFFVKGHD